jgi:hypothetical protein
MIKEERWRKFNTEFNTPGLGVGLDSAFIVAV